MGAGLCAGLRRSAAHHSVCVFSRPCLVGLFCFLSAAEECHATTCNNRLDRLFCFRALGFTPLLGRTAIERVALCGNRCPAANRASHCSSLTHTYTMPACAPRPAHGREEGGLDRHLGDADLQDSRRREPLNIAIDRIARRDISFIVIVARPAEFSQ